MDIQDQDPAASAGGTPSNPNRRRFASTGAKASGVILTLVSAPGMAAAVCKTPSGSLSGNLKVSSHSTQNLYCNGLSPGYWKNWPDQWPPSCYPTTTSQHHATMFASVFPYGWTDLYKTGSFMDVLVSNDPAQDPYNLGMHLVAAYLNVKSRPAKTNVFTVTTLKNIWHDLYTYGYYSPMAGKKWYPSDVAQYLMNTEN